ncbi:Uncharacterised protein [uncultured archaeon]|nr:Uncharacterised protein [uncultured archaeon]
MNPWSRATVVPSLSTDTARVLMRCMNDDLPEWNGPVTSSFGTNTPMPSRPCLNGTTVRMNFLGDFSTMKNARVSDFSSTFLRRMTYSKRLIISSMNSPEKSQSTSENIVVVLISYADAIALSSTSREREPPYEKYSRSTSLNTITALPLFSRMARSTVFATSSGLVGSFTTYLASEGWPSLEEKLSMNITLSNVPESHSFIAPTRLFTAAGVKLSTKNRHLLPLIALK